MTLRRLVLFDFDGTLTDRDTMLAFALHCRGPYRFWAGLLWLAPLLVGLQLRLLPRDVAKVIFLRHFLGGMTRATLERFAASFADRIDGFVRPAARRALAEHRERGDEVAIVSASLDLWLAPFASAHGLPLLCTEAAFSADGVFEGQLATPNCNGPEKARRIREAFALEEFGEVVAYGDSAGDREMLALADEALYKPFRGDR